MTSVYVDHGNRHGPGGTDPVPQTQGAVYQIKITGDGTDASTGDGKHKLTIPPDLDGVKLTSAHAAVTTPSTSGLTTVQIENHTAGVDMLSTRITIDPGEKTSYDPDAPPATPPVIDPTHATVGQGDEIWVDVDTVGTPAPKGLAVILVFGAPPGGANVGPPGADGEDGAVGPPGPPGPPGATYTHTQTALASTWVIVHNLGVHPSVSVVDTGDSVILPDVHYDNTNQVTLTFGAATSGKAFLN